MMRLCAAWRNTLFKRTTGTASDSMMSASTRPGPTEGSWSISPTSKIAAAFGTAATRACIKGASTIEVSSTITKSHSRGLVSLNLNRPFLGSMARSRWIVSAGMPVASLSFFAALPVGAQSKIRVPSADKIFRTEFKIVVLPTPGPPVITKNFDSIASRTASAWLSENSMPAFVSAHGNALRWSIFRQGVAPELSSRIFSANACSIRCAHAVNTQDRPETSSATKSRDRNSFRNALSTSSRVISGRWSGESSDCGALPEGTIASTFSASDLRTSQGRPRFPSSIALVST